MELRDVWTLYCEPKFPDPDNLPDLEPITPRETAMLLFENSFLFTARMQTIEKTPYDKAFDEEVDGALIWLARFDNFDLWDEMSAGSWRVMYERFAYSIVVCGANAVAKNPVIAHLPIGLDPRSRARAILLQFLLGGARTIDPRLLAKHKNEGPPDLASLRPIRKQ